MSGRIADRSAGRFLLRIVTSDEPDRVGEEIPITGQATIGREAICGVVLVDGAVSRYHARIEPTADGLTLTDLESANGSWVGGERVTEALMKPGGRFTIGSTVFECLSERESPTRAEATGTMLLQPSPAPSAFATAISGAQGFVLEVVASAEGGLLGKQATVRRGSAIVGRGEDCTFVLGDKDVSRQHAKIESLADGTFRVTDLGSSNGTWVDDTRIRRPTTIEAEDELRLGDTTRITCRPKTVEPPSETASEVADPEGTVVMQTSLRQVDGASWIEEAGEPLELSATRPFLLDDPETAWYVVSGGVDIFTVSVEAGEAVGTRAHFLGIVPGQCFLGFDLGSYREGSAFLAVANQDTLLREIRVSRLRELAATPATADAVATLLDTWVAGLSKSLTRNIEIADAGEATLRDGEGVVLRTQSRASAAEGAVWLDAWSGSLLFLDMATPVFTGRKTLFPVTPDSWIQPVGDEFGDLSLTPLATAEVVADTALWQGLEVFHQVVRQCEFINRKLAAADEAIRLQKKAAYAEAAQHAAYAAIGSVLGTGAATPREFLQTGGGEPVLEACRLVGKATGIEVKGDPGADESRTYEERVNAIAGASGFRARVVALRGDWWKQDHGPLLGQLAETEAPVAILPAGTRSYECIDSSTGSRSEVDGDVAAEISGFAYAFYRAFPDGPLSIMDLVRSGARGLASDFRMLVLMGVLIGMLGTVVPYITGRIFDSALPQADRTLLLGFGLALVGVASAMSMFKLVQGIAMVRVEGRMEYSVQAALWDRLLKLPASFFRKYSAGDLAERVDGIDAIQQLVSGAGIVAILGSLSGLFYVALMIAYSPRLALVAVLLALVYVGVTMLGNYLQLRHQRVEITLQGRIAGLVLNLITGVTKLRTSGAEHHAFRVWAQQFAAQRKVSFNIGRIQSMVTVFSTSFPVLSSMAIFAAIAWAPSQVTDNGATVLTIGEFIAFTAAYGLFLGAMQALGDASMNMLRILPIYERLKPIITTPAEVDDTKVYPGNLSGGIEMSQVHFRYIDDGPWFMKGLSLKAEPGEFLAIVGGSGCGKSTLLRLMLGFETPANGAVFYDGQDLRTLDLRTLRQQLGVVLQVSRVMPTDIYRNIVGDSPRSVDEAWEAAEMAGLADDIRAMPMQMHTYVAEGGGTLSGGQRQRLLIARAIVRRPKILFLDEATSALDNRAQATVTESLDRMEATRIVIAHRLSTVINADRICYLDGGQIAEMGTYQELMEMDGLFAQLARRQMA